MRDKIIEEVARVRLEADHGRLRWTAEDGQSLVHKYPTHDCDEGLARVEHDQKFDEVDEYEETAAMASKEQ